jgi:hypothetical protein
VNTCTADSHHRGPELLASPSLDAEFASLAGPRRGEREATAKFHESLAAVARSSRLTTSPTLVALVTDVWVNGAPRRDFDSRRPSNGTSTAVEAECAALPLLTPGSRPSSFVDDRHQVLTLSARHRLPG